MITKDHAVSLPQDHSVDLSYILSKNDGTYELIENTIDIVRGMSRVGRMAPPPPGFAIETINLVNRIQQKAKGEKHKRRAEPMLTEYQLEVSTPGFEQMWLYHFGPGYGKSV